MSFVSFTTYFRDRKLELFVEIASGTRDINSAWNPALAVLHALDDARRLAALGTVGRLRRVHYLLAVTCFRYLGHRSGVSPSGVVSAHTRKLAARGFNGAVICCLSSQLVLPGRSGTRSNKFTSSPLRPPQFGWPVSGAGVGGFGGPACEASPGAACVSAGAGAGDVCGASG